MKRDGGTYLVVGAADGPSLLITVIKPDGRVGEMYANLAGINMIQSATIVDPECEER